MRHLTRSKLRAAPLALALFLAATPAQAQERGGNLLDVIVDSVSSLWSFLVDAASDAGGAVTPASPLGTLKSIKGEDKSEFWSMLEDAGYDLKEIETEIGLIPGIEATYLLKRELSEADREALEARIDKHTEEEGGLVAFLERSIIFALLDASELGEYRIEEVKIQFLPLPKATFVLAPAESPLEEEHDRIYRAVREQRRDIRRTGEAIRQEHMQPATPRVSTQPLR